MKVLRKGIKRENACIAMAAIQKEVEQGGGRIIISANHSFTYAKDGETRFVVYVEPNIVEDVHDWNL